jgi:hypothetical protein
MSGSNRDTWRPTLESAVRMDAAGLPVNYTAEEYRSGALWPTPQAADGLGGRTVRSSNPGGGGKSLMSEVRLWPTPKATTGSKSERPRPNDRGDLQAAVLLWPTPSAGNFNDGENLDNWQTRRKQNRAKGINGNGMGTPLAVAVRLWPTPTAVDGTSGPGHGHTMEGSPSLRTAAQDDGEMLNPAWVEALMGFPPGWTDIGGPPPRASRRRNGSRPAPSPEPPTATPA